MRQSEFIKKTRPINNELRLSILSEIKAVGVNGSHIRALPTVFSARENECQVALNISDVTWNRHGKESGMIQDAALSILIHWYYLHPEAWPVQYTPDEDIEDLSRKLDLPISLPMMIGRSKLSFYRWAIHPPKDHIKKILNILGQLSEKNEEKELLRDFLKIAKHEAKLRNIDIEKDNSWS